MKKLQLGDLFSLEQYHRKRPDFRKQVMAHKRHRQVPLGEHATLYFEDALTMQYQVQEMLRVERIFEEEAIHEELATYNPLIPDGTNLKATFMLEYADVDQRRRELARLMGVEDRVWARVEGNTPVRAIANEDLERSTAEKTSSVHFLRFEFTQAMIDALKQGASLAFGVDHEHYNYSVDPVSAEIRASLLADFS
ncbi:MAG: DUF3501 family protein [Gammaproteobacteria bacterium]|jgi:hypothetical protein|nr:DUF3501 family protein [Gammaproteobacteria bacterium]